MGLEKDALVTYKRLTEKVGLSEKIATFLVSKMGRGTLEDLENVSEAQVNEEIIPTIADMNVPLVMGEANDQGNTEGSKSLVRQEAEGSSGGRGCPPCHRRIQALGIAPFQQLQTVHLCGRRRRRDSAEPLEATAQ